jgi:hypothetical protein
MPDPAAGAHKRERFPFSETRSFAWKLAGPCLLPIHSARHAFNVWKISCPCLWPQHSAPHALKILPAARNSGSDDRFGTYAHWESSFQIRPLGGVLPDSFRGTKINKGPVQDPQWKTEERVGLHSFLGYKHSSNLATGMALGGAVS